MKYSRLQSIEAPNLLICLVIVDPDCSFHSQTFSKNFSRPRSCLEIFLASNWRSTTIWVAIPAWSVPGTQRVFLPCIRAWRVSPSMMVWLNACPIWSVPVTLGGGSWMQKFSCPSTILPRPMFFSSQAARRRGSTAPGSKDLANSWPFSGEF